eukprot:4537043-Karenia_brevis.AAC.1
METSQSGGMEGWLTAELKMLPIPFFVFLATLSNIIEETGQWPQTLERALVSIMPKGIDVQP